MSTGVVEGHSQLGGYPLDNSSQLRLPFGICHDGLKHSEIISAQLLGHGSTRLHGCVRRGTRCLCEERGIFVLGCRRYVIGQHAAKCVCIAILVLPSLAIHLLVSFMTRIAFPRVGTSEKPGDGRAGSQRCRIRAHPTRVPPYSKKSQVQLEYRYQCT